VERQQLVHVDSARALSFDLGASCRQQGPENVDVRHHGGRAPMVVVGAGLPWHGVVVLSSSSFLFHTQKACAHTIQWCKQTHQGDRQRGTYTHTHTHNTQGKGKKWLSPNLAKSTAGGQNFTFGRKRSIIKVRPNLDTNGVFVCPFLCFLFVVAPRRTTSAGPCWYTMRRVAAKRPQATQQPTANLGKFSLFVENFTFSKVDPILIVMMFVGHCA
jgi:hypothetical protein